MIASNGKAIEVGGPAHSGDLAIFNVPSGDRLSFLEGYLGEGPAAHFSGCGRYVIDATWGGLICIRTAEDLSLAGQYNFEQEMVVNISHDASKSIWCFNHQPKTPAGKNFAPPPYLQLWRWPFKDNEPRRIPLQIDSLDSAVISPCGTLIASLGYARAIHVAAPHS